MLLYMFTHVYLYATAAVKYRLGLLDLFVLLLLLLW